MQAVTEFMQECLYFIESQQSRLVLGRLGEIHDDGYMWTAVFTSLFIYPLFFVWLVDKLGGIDDALAAAAKRANVENYTIISYPEKESLFMNLLNSQRKHYVNSQMKEYMGSFYSYFEILQNLKEINPVQARMPFELNIK